MHIRSAGIDADLAQDGDRCVAHDLQLLVGESLRRRHRDRVAGVDAHRIEILDRADDDAIVFLVAHDFHLELFPAAQRLLDQELARGRGVEAAFAHFDEFVSVVGDAPAGAPERERRADHRRKADLGLHLESLLEVMRYARARGSEPDARHRRLEFFAVFRLVDRFLRRPDQLDVVLVEHALAREVERAIERGLPAHRRQERVGPLALDDLGEHRPGDRLDVGDVGHLRIGHDRRRIGVDQDDLVVLLAQRLARLRARIVELAGLADDDRAGADDQDRGDVGSLGHGTRR